MQILAATDFSTRSNRALRQAGLLAQGSNDQVTLVHVVDDDQPFASRWTFFIGLDGRILYVDKQVNAAIHGKMIAAKLAELGVPRRGSK